MAEVDAGALAPVETQPVPGADQPVQTSGAPAAGAEQPDAGKEPVQPPKTYSEEDMRKTVSDRLNKERRRLERQIRAEVERDYYKQLAERGGGQPGPAKADQPKGKPKPSDYEDPEQYLDALTEWKLEQREAARKAQSEQETKFQREQRLEAERARLMEEKVIRPGMAKHRDFADVVMSEDVPITDVMLASAARLKGGVDVLYHLGKNPEEANRIAQLSDLEQAWEIRDLERKLTAPASPSKAPPPIVPNNPAAASKNPYDGSDTKAHVEAWLKRKK